MWLASLAALMLLLSIGLLVFVLPDRADTQAKQQSTVELSKTVSRLTGLVTANGSSWAQSDELARLIAAGDMQVQELRQSTGVTGRILPTAKSSVVSEVSADWKLLREGLVAFNQSGQFTPPITATEATSTSAPVAQSNQVLVPSTDLALIAANFESVRARVLEGTRDQTLIELVNSTSLLWAGVNSAAIDATALTTLVSQQQAYARDLITLTKVGTDNSLYGYYTSQQIIDYAQAVEGIQLVTVESPRAEASPPVRSTAASAAPVNSRFVTEALAQLKLSVQKALADNASSSTNSGRLIWLGLAGLVTSLLLLLSALRKMKYAASSWRSAVLSQPAPAAVRSGALSLRDADQLIDDIGAVAGGDLRHSIRVPDRGHGRAIAESVNRTGAVVRNLVGMTRGVADRLKNLVQQHDRLGRTLAENDIRRQTETAELSDYIGIRSELLDEQRSLLTAAEGLTKKIGSNSDSAVNGVKEVSSSLATVSAQVEVSSGRMQRLLQTANMVTASTEQLKSLAEQTRLQALNASLKMPNDVTDRVLDEMYDAFEYREDSTDLFGEIHHLTARLVKVSNDADGLITALQKDIAETAQALKDSGNGVNQGAHSTHSTSLVGKELVSYCSQLQANIEDALASIDLQKDELSRAAELIVRLDKTGNNTSDLTSSLNQDIIGLQQMASKLDESVAGFKMRGESAT